MTGSLRASSLATAYRNIMQRYLLPRLPAWGITPDRLTWLGVLASLLVPLGYWIHPFWGMIMMLLSGMADSLDGLMARHQNRSSLWGAFLDSGLDRVSDFFYLLGFWVLFGRYTNPLLAGAAIFLCTLLTMLISYTKARAEGLGCDCPVGLMERGLRVVYLVAWTLVIIVMPGSRAIYLWIGLAVYAILCLATVIQRVLYVRGRMAATGESTPGKDRRDGCVRQV